MMGLVMVTRDGGCAGKSLISAVAGEEKQDEEKQELSLLDFLLSALRKSIVSTCRVDRQDREVISVVHSMEIGCPTNVQHLIHVTFDRFHGFLGLPIELEMEIPHKAPSASISVFGVSPDSMQCSYDARGNSVPSILLLMQEKLYAQNGLKSEGIFRINPENSQEELVRDQLNRGIVPEDVEVHCLAGLIKAWFRELPSGVLDGLSPEQVLHCNTEEDECMELIRQLNLTENALLGWAINLMADVVEQEEFNKMNARNIAMVFAPNMTQMSDPLTALMHAVQVTNLLKTLILRTLRHREEESREGYSPVSSRSLDRHGDYHYDSLLEMDNSCQSTPLYSDDDEQGRYCLRRELKGVKDELESFSEVEESYLRHLNDNESAKNSFREQLKGILCREYASPVSSTFRTASSPTPINNRVSNSFINPSNGKDHGVVSISQNCKIEASRIPIVDYTTESDESEHSCLTEASA